MTTTRSGGVLVGLGGPETGPGALDWAAHEASLRHLDLQIVRAYFWSSGIGHWAAEGDEIERTTLVDATYAQVRLAVEHVAVVWPDLRVTGTVVEGSAGRVMVDLSTAASLTVLGSRQLGIIGAAVLGSVSTLVAAQASAAVVVVNGPPGVAAEGSAVVCGIEDSPADHDVLSFAFDHASRHGCSLHAVLCWHPDLLVSTQWRLEQPAPEQAQRWLSETLAGWQEKYPDVTVTQAVVRDHPVAGLVAASMGQELVVVGARSHRVHVAALLGSVSQGVLHHARCPVAVVHPARTADINGETDA